MLSLVANTWRRRRTRRGKKAGRGSSKRIPENVPRDVLDDLESAMKDLSGVAEEGDNSAEGDHDDLMLDIEEVMNI